MQEYKVGKAIVRIHGKPNMANVKEATAVFMKEVRDAKKKAKQHA